MVMKAVKLDEKTIAVALLYGKSVNSGILSMQRLIKETIDRCLKFEQDEERKHKELLEAISNLRVTLPVNQKVTESFRPANTLPRIKEIGKILPEERLEDPVGRQGRSV